MSVTQTDDDHLAPMTTPCAASDCGRLVAVGILARDDKPLEALARQAIIVVDDQLLLDGRGSLGCVEQASKQTSQ